jgi:hypothetical protein
MGKPNPMTYYQPDPTAMAARQEKADNALRLHNQNAPRHLEGETEVQYARRLAEKVQKYAPNMKYVNINEAMGSAFELIEKQIYEDARREAAHPTMIPEGELREVKTADETGRQISQFYGHPKAWISNFSHEPKRLAGLRTETQRGWRPSN